MTRRLLRYFFSWETLARSSATGQLIAHSTTMEHPLCLPLPMGSAIKGTRRVGWGGGSHGHGATHKWGLSPAEQVTTMRNFNAGINSKRSTSRRAVKKLVEKMG